MIKPAYKKVTYYWNVRDKDGKLGPWEKKIQQRNISQDEVLATAKHLRAHMKGELKVTAELNV